MMDQLSVSQFKALLYADIFEYPLTKQELGKFQISKLSDVSIGPTLQSDSVSKHRRVRPQASDKSQINSKFQITSNFRQKNDYFYLSGRQNLIVLRKQKEKYSEEKIIIAQKAANLLRVIPTIQMIVITGALAMNNTKEDDDIDFLVVTSKNRIWLSRLWSIILLEIFGLRRRPNDTDWNNKICLNMFIDEAHLSLPKKERDLFSAHEAAQIRVLWSRGDIEKRWWMENKWIGRYLPNFKFKIQKKYLSIWIVDFICHLSFVICHFWEKVCKVTQLSYMHPKRTQEVITDGYLRFHPHDARKWIFEEYQKRLRKYGLG